MSLPVGLNQVTAAEEEQDNVVAAAASDNATPAESGAGYFSFLSGAKQDENPVAAVEEPEQETNTVSAPQKGETEKHQDKEPVAEEKHEDAVATAAAGPE